VPRLAAGLRELALGDVERGLAPGERLGDLGRGALRPARGAAEQHLVARVGDDESGERGDRASERDLSRPEGARRTRSSR